MERQLRTQMSVWQQGYHNRSLGFFLGTFILDFEYYLFIVSATLWHIFVENQKGVIFMGVVAKH